MPEPDDRRAITITEPRLSRTGDGGWRLSAGVGADEVHVASDLPLAANADAFVAAYLLAAAKAGATLRVDADLDTRLHAAVPALCDVARRYWGFPGASVAARRVVARAPAGGAAMFFTGGVDSFYTLWRRRGSLDRLIFVDGFDLGLDDRERFAPVRAAIEEIARETGLGAAFPRTNLRRDRAFAAMPWGWSFGAALAAVGHALAPTASTVYIASSSIRTGWGSTPELDPLWSSGAVAFVHDGDETTKLEKARAIGEWPLVHRFLRVCFAPRRDGFNCGACEKCVRTQVLFAAVGLLDRLTTFPRAPLVERIDGVPHVPPVNRAGWANMRERCGDARVAAAIDRMLARRPTAAERLRDAVRPWLDGLPGGRVVRAAGRRLLSR